MADNNQNTGKKRGRPKTPRKVKRVMFQNRKKTEKTVQLLNSIQLPTTNKFAALQTSDDANAMEHDQLNQTTTNTKKTSIPPIVITDHTTDVQAILKELALENCNLKINSIGRKILPNTADEKKKIEECLKTKNIYFYTHPDKNEKVFKIILSGLPQVDVKHIEESLKAQNVTPTKITMFNTQSKSKLYLIHFNAEQVNKKTLDGIKYVYHHVIKWQVYKPKRTGATICMRCCTYGHAQRSCFRYIVCMLCAGEHLTSACTVHKKGENTNNAFTCYNCKSANLSHNHKANDVKCPFRAKYEMARNNMRNKTTPSQHTQTNTARYTQAPSPPPLRSSYADSMRTATSSSSRTYTNAAATNNTQSQARTHTNTGARSNNIPSYSNNNNIDSANVNNNLWSFDECANILFDSIERLQKCTTKMEQLLVITDLLKHACK
jgi:hypothetical protein